MKKKILIVEDDRGVRELERNVMRQNGFDVLEATNARDGIDLAVREIPDLVIMDIRLPSKKRGIGASKIIRKEPALREVPIIFVTGYAGGDTTAEIANIPRTEYLLKPFKVEDLVRLVKKYI